MSIELQNVAIPKTARSVTSKYAFGSLVVGGPALVETEVVNAKKAQSKLTSALVAYRARTGDKSKFTIRTFTKVDGTEAVGAWKVADAPAVATTEATTEA